jgi:ring-1,2-phenylacetyl-CoA epoxidase subunit PaaB
MSKEWPLWEIFIRSKTGLDHRMEGVSIWAVESKYIHASNPDDAPLLYDPANDKVYRHPTFYNLPDELKHM